MAISVGVLEFQMAADLARLTKDMATARSTIGGAVTKMNAVLGAIGVGISVDFLLDLTRRSNEYSKSLAALSTQLGDSTHKIKELDSASKNLSAQFGTSAIKQSAAFYEILSSGITDTAQATTLLTEANRLAIGGNADLMVSVDGLTSIIKGYGGAAGTAAEISDTLFTASLAGKLSIQELSDGIGKVIPLASTMGVSLEEVTSAISALTLGGISAKESITGIRAILAAIAKPSSEAARLAHELGLGFNSAAVQSQGLAAFLEDVKVKTKGSSDSMAMLFGGVESLIPALALTGNAGKEFNSIIEQMANKAGATEDAFNKMAAAPGFKIDQLMASINSIAITLGDTLANYLAPAAEKAARFLNNLFGVTTLSGIDKQIKLITELSQKIESMTNRKHIPLVGGLLFDKKEFDLLSHQLDMAREDLAAMQKTQELQSKVTQESTVKTIQNADAQKKNGSAVAKTTKDIDKQVKSFDMQLHLLRQYDDEAKRSRDITQSVATEQEIYNQKLEELNRLKPYLTIETYDRALLKLNETNKKVEVSTERTTDQVSQLWMQAGRNIQSSLANSIFNFFDDGLNGMVKNVGIAVGRILSEFAALKLAQTIGLDSMFGMVGGIGGTGKGGMGAFDIASMGSEAMSFFKGGSKGLGSMLGRGASAMGATSFGAGASGAASAGVFGAGGLPFLGGAGTAIGGTGVGAAAAATEFGAMATMGAGMSAIAGPLAALTAGFMGGKMLAGKNKIAGIGGTEAALIGTALGGPVGAVVAGAILKLFGREAYKFRQQSLQGTASNAGFEGDITNVERAKGGLLRSNGHRSKSVALTSEMQDLFDTAIGAYYKSAHGFAESMGLNVKLVDDYSKEFQIKSEKGKVLTGEAVTAMIAEIGDSLATNLIPIIATLKKGEETAFQTLTRLGGEFDALASGAMNLGASLQYAKEILKVSTFEGRSSFIEAAGGIDALAAKTKFFADTFLNDAERIAPSVQELSATMSGMGLSADMTGEQFKNLVQSFGTVNGISEETLQTLLTIAPAYASVNAVFKSLETGIINMGGSAEWARQAVLGLSVDTRLAYLDALGGVEDFATNTAEFNNRFLSKAEQMTPFIKEVEDGLAHLGLSANLSKKEFKDLTQSLLISDNVDDKLKGAFMLANNVLFDNVSIYKDSLIEIKEATVEAFQSIGLGDQATNALGKVQKSIDAERTRLTVMYNQEVMASESHIKDVTDTIARLADVAGSVKSAVSSINSISLDQARSQVKNGNSESSNVKEAIAALGQQQTSAGFSNVLEFKRSTAANVGLLNKMGTGLDSQINLQKQSLTELQAFRGSLESGFNGEMMRLDSMLENAQSQVASLQGIDTKTLTIVGALGELNRILIQGGEVGVSAGGSVPVSGNSKISSADIVRFVDANRNDPMAIYRAAIKNGVSSRQIAATGIYSQKQIDDFVKKNNLASFDVGGVVPRDGIAMLHKNEQVLTTTDSQGLSANIEKLNRTVEFLTIANNKMNRRFDKWDNEGTPPIRTAV